MRKQDRSRVAQDRDTPDGSGFSPGALWAARLMVALVCAWNLTAALPFVFNPSAYTRSFEVNGAGLGGEVPGPFGPAPRGAREPG